MGLLSETTMNFSPLYDASVVLTSTPSIVVNGGRSSKFPYSTDTYTRGLPKIASSETYTKKARRRSKSVDFHIGEKTIISPSLCQLCVSRQSRPRNGNDDSPTLPWCPHSQMPVSINVTPARSLLKPGCSPSSSKMPLKPILKKKFMLKKLPGN